jgi:hypothetical protein
MNGVDIERINMFITFLATLAMGLIIFVLIAATTTLGQAAIMDHIQAVIHTKILVANSKIVPF